MPTQQVVHARRSCEACRRLKRRCSKTFPRCSLCTRVGRACEYSHGGGTRTSPGLTTGLFESDDHDTSIAFQGQFALDINASNVGESVLSEASSVVSLQQADHNLAAHFMDSVATRGRPVQSVNLKWSEIAIDHEALSLLAARDAVDTFRRTVHLWLPVVSLKRLSRRMANAHDLAQADLQAMLYAMLMLTIGPNEQAPTLRRTLRKVLNACLSNGHHSTALLAAEILIAYYETAHGMFPSAYHSAARISRLCYSLGLHDKRKATQFLPKAESWTEVEERRRLWWAVIVLDKYLHVGFRFRPLFTAPVPADEILPARDEDWDRGQIAVNPLLVMSIETQLAVSPFARLCQAAHLLGRTCEHVNDHPSVVDADMHFQEAAQIRRAIVALQTLISEDIQTIDHAQIASSLALCLSALSLLYDVHSCVEVDEVEACGGNRGLRVELQQMAIDGAQQVVSYVNLLAAQISQLPLHKTSPLTLHCLYSAAGVLAWNYREMGEERDLEQLNYLRDMLRRMGTRWHAANSYLQLLHDAEHINTGACYQ